MQPFFRPWLSMTYFEPIGRREGNRVGFGIGTLLRFRGRLASQCRAFASVRAPGRLCPLSTGASSSRRNDVEVVAVVRVPHGSENSCRAQAPYCALTRGGFG